MDGIGPDRKQVKIDEEKDVDIISNLGETIKAKILSYLPIKEAIKTSTLSTKWRQTWTMVPELDIRDSYFSSTKLPENRSRLVKFVDVLFFMHKGPIRSFKLSTKQCCHDALARWIPHLSRNGLSELTLELTCKRKLKLHSSFFSCKDLSLISLSNCLVKLPQEFEGFKVLSVLKLENCSLNGSEIERFVSSCPLLKDLSLRKFRDSSSLKIDAPNLESLKVDGKFADLQLFTPRLSKACIDLEKNPAEGCLPKNAGRSKLLKAFYGAPGIKMLGIHRHFLQYLAQGNLQDENQVPDIFLHLKYLTLDIDLSNREEIQAASFLLQNALNLEDLDVIISSSSKVTAVCTPSALSFCSARNVLVEDFILSELNFEFLRSILKGFAFLQTLTISCEKACYDKQALVLYLYQLGRASACVQISHL